MQFLQFLSIKTVKLDLFTFRGSTLRSCKYNCLFPARLSRQVPDIPITSDRSIHNILQCRTAGGSPFRVRFQILHLRGGSGSCLSGVHQDPHYRTSGINICRDIFISRNNDRFGRLLINRIPRPPHDRRIHCRKLVTLLLGSHGNHDRGLFSIPESAKAPDCSC